MEGDLKFLEELYTGDRPVERTTPVASQPIPVMKMLRSVHTYPNVNLLLLEEFAPGSANQRSIGLKCMLDRQPRRPQLLDYRESATIELDREYQGFPSMPHN
jgi:hypothetical protein